MCVCEFLVIVPVCANDYVLDCSAIPCNRKRAGCAASLTKSCNWVERAHEVDYIWGSWTYLYSFSNWHTIGYLLVMQYHSHLSSVLFQFVLLLLRFFWQIAQLLSGRLPAACYHIRIRAQPQPDPSPFLSPSPSLPLLLLLHRLPLLHCPWNLPAFPLNVITFVLLQAAEGITCATPTTLATAH